MALSQFRTGLQCVSKWSACGVRRGIRTTASEVHLSVPLDDCDEDNGSHTRAPPSTSSSALPKPNKITSTLKTLPSPEPHPGYTTEKQALSLSEHRLSHVHRILEKAMRKPTPEPVRSRRENTKRSFPEGWNPPHKVSRQAMEGLRVLHMHDPKTFTVCMLAERFRISPQAVSRILRSKWQTSSEQQARLLRREMREKEIRVQSKINAERETFKALGVARADRKRTEDRLTFE